MSNEIIIGVMISDDDFIAHSDPHDLTLSNLCAIFLASTTIRGSFAKCVGGQLVDRTANKLAVPLTPNVRARWVSRETANELAVRPESVRLQFSRALSKRINKKGQ